MMVAKVAMVAAAAADAVAPALEFTSTKLAVRFRFRHWRSKTPSFQVARAASGDPEEPVSETAAVSVVRAVRQGSISSYCGSGCKN